MVCHLNGRTMRTLVSLWLSYVYLVAGGTEVNTESYNLRPGKALMTFLFLLRGQPWKAFLQDTFGIYKYITQKPNCKAIMSKATWVFLFLQIVYLSSKIGKTCQLIGTFFRDSHDKSTFPWVYILGGFVVIFRACLIVF